MDVWSHKSLSIITIQKVISNYLKKTVRRAQALPGASKDLHAEDCDSAPVSYIK